MFIFLQFHCKTYTTTTTTTKIKMKTKIDFQFSFTTKTTKKTNQLSVPFNETLILVGYSVAHWKWSRIYEGNFCVSGLCDTIK